jgi:hypothetical protein
VKNYSSQVIDLNSNVDGLNPGYATTLILICYYLFTTSGLFIFYLFLAALGFKISFGLLGILSTT